MVEELEHLNILHKSWDVIIYDVLGDVVCGGFSVPMREKYVDAIYIVSSSDIKKCLKEDFAMKNISILSTIKKGTNSENFYINNRYSEVKFFEEEKKLLEEISSGDIIIADPIFQNFIPYENKVKFIPLPYLGFSGREFSHIDYKYIGEKGFNYFKKYLKN